MCKLININLSILIKMTAKVPYINLIWKPPRLSEPTPMIFDMGLTHLDSEVSIYDHEFLQ